MDRPLVMDSSSVIVLNRRKRLEEYLKRRRDQGYQVFIPQAIAKELIYEPRRYAEKIKSKSPSLTAKILGSVDRINHVIEQGLIQVKTVNYMKYSKLMDNVRKYLSQLDAQPEHAVKKGDPELITLVIQLYEKYGTKISVSTKDKGLLKALEPFNNRIEYQVLESP